MCSRERDAHCCGYADGGSPPYSQRVDRSRDIVHGREGESGFMAGECALVDDVDGSAVGGPADGFGVRGADHV
ncbi:hypothetical protein D3C83_171470 [compost metagenome]